MNMNSENTSGKNFIPSLPAVLRSVWASGESPAPDDVLAALVPGLGSTAAAEAVLDGDAARFRLYDAVAQYLIAAAVAVAVICLLLWMHGNSGGWQLGYRYAIAILPFMFVILLENSPKKITVFEWIVYAFSFIANAYATWLFHWTDRLKP